MIVTSDDNSKDAGMTMDANHARLVALGRAFYPLMIAEGIGWDGIKALLFEVGLHAT